ncbi:putative carboxylesterase 2 [Salvia divinorum]|uniref:Carboxylesterase 2 n=1 Tax=Salvia divinorum TaxID=28513 RepID=A0ABD1G8K3_SALDI
MAAAENEHELVCKYNYHGGAFLVHHLHSTLSQLPTHPRTRSQARIRRLAEPGCLRVQVTVAENDLLKDRGWLYYQALGWSRWLVRSRYAKQKGRIIAFIWMRWKKQVP